MRRANYLELHHRATDLPMPKHLQVCLLLPTCIQKCMGPEDESQKLEHNVAEGVSREQLPPGSMRTRMLAFPIKQKSATVEHFFSARWVGFSWQGAPFVVLTQYMKVSRKIPFQFIFKRHCHRLYHFAYTEVLGGGVVPFQRCFHVP